MWTHDLLRAPFSSAPCSRVISGAPSAVSAGTSATPPSLNDTYYLRVNCRAVLERLRSPSQDRNRRGGSPDLRRPVAVARHVCLPHRSGAECLLDRRRERLAGSPAGHRGAGPSSRPHQSSHDAARRVALTLSISVPNLRATGLGSDEYNSDDTGERATGRFLPSLNPPPGSQPLPAPR